MAHQHVFSAHDAVFRNFQTLIGGSGMAWDRRRCWGPLQASAAVFVMRCPDTEHSMRTAIPATKELFGAMFGWTSVPDAAGLSRARRRVTEAETAALHERILNWSLASAAPNGRLVPDMPVIAVDGSTLHVPRSRSLLKAYPISTDRIGRELHHYPQAHLVSAWDVERRIPISCG